MQRLFHDDKPLRHKAFTDYSYSEENVDDPTSLDYIIIVDIVEDIPLKVRQLRLVELCFLPR